MQTDLAELFRGMAKFSENEYVPFGGGAEKIALADLFIARLKSSSASKLRAEICTADDLFRQPRFALLLYDALILFGVPSENNAGIRIELWSEGEGDKGGQDPGPRELKADHPYPAFGYFGSQVIRQWTEDARPFIEDGRLIYVPKRMEVLFHLHPQGYASMQMVNVDYTSPWAVWNAAIAAKREGADALLPETLRATDQRMQEVISTAFPFIDGIPLSLLHQVMSDEADTLVHFRKATAQLIQQSYAETKGDDDPERLREVGSRLRRDIVEPEMAKLNLQLRKIVQTRSIRMAGAVLGTAALAIAAIPVAGVTAILASTLGAGGLGLLAREYAEYRAEVMSLEENPWYFAWKLKRESAAS